MEYLLFCKKLFKSGLTGIVEVTERTRFCPEIDGETDRQTDRRTDDMKPVYPLFKFVEAGGGGYNYRKHD